MSPKVAPRLAWWINQHPPAGSGPLRQRGSNHLGSVVESGHAPGRRPGRRRCRKSFALSIFGASTIDTRRMSRRSRSLPTPRHRSRRERRLPALNVNVNRAGSGSSPVRLSSGLRVCGALRPWSPDVHRCSRHERQITIELAERTYSKRAAFLPRSRDRPRPQPGLAQLVDQSRRCRSAVPRCFLSELYARGESEFGVDVGEVGLHGAR